MQSYLTLCMSTSNPWLLLDRSNILSLSVSLSVPKSQTSIHHGIWSCIGQRVAFSYQEGLDFLYTAIHTRKLDNEKKTKLWRNWQWVGLVMECTLKRMLQMFGTKNWYFYLGEYLLFFFFFFGDYFNKDFWLWEFAKRWL